MRRFPARGDLALATLDIWYNPPMRVLLIRHGQTAWNAEQRAQGQTDIPLDEEGREQARLLAEGLDDQPLARVLSSDLQRAFMTAEVLARPRNLTLEARPDLRERAFGQWEGVPFLEIRKRFTEEAMLAGLERSRIRPPGGESQQDVWNRLDPVVADLRATLESTAVVTHGGTCALLLARLLGSTLETAAAFRFDNTGVTTIERRPDGGFQLLAYNDVTHLRRPALAGSVDGAVR